jgi:hypothetical protein
MQIRETRVSKQSETQEKWNLETGISENLFRWCLFEAENDFPFLHQIEPIARQHFEICRIGFQQIHFAGLPGQQNFLLANLIL